MGGIDTLVHITGPPKPGMFKDLGDEDWELGVRLLILNAVWVVRKALTYLLTYLRNSVNPSIIFLTGTAVREPDPYLTLSNVLRVGIHGLMKTLVRELGPEGIRVNAVMPGYIETGRVRNILETRASRTRSTTSPQSSGRRTSGTRLRETSSSP